MRINFLYDPSAQSVPAGFKSALAAAADYLGRLVLDPITVTIEVGYGEDAGLSLGGALGIGGPASGENLTYSQVKDALAAHATSAADATALDTLPRGDPVSRGSYFVAAATAKAWGLLPADGAEIDGSVGFSSSAAFNYDPNNRAIAGQYDFLGTALHELTHALGRISDAAPMALFQYSAPGVLALTSGQPAYFSIDGGATDLGNFDVTSDDADWASGSAPDAFDAYSGTGREYAVTPTDVTELDVLGFTVAPGLAQGSASAIAMVQGGQWLTTPAGQSTVVTDQSTGGNVVASQGNDTVNSGSGSITIVSATAGAQLRVNLGSGDALVFPSAADASIALGTGASTIVGGPGTLTISGSPSPGGEDTIFGSSVSLTAVSGGAERMLFVGGSGSSAVTVGAAGGGAFAGSGGSTLIATAPNTFLAGNVSGDQLVVAGIGGDMLAAGGGNETLNGADAVRPDVMFGGSGDTLIRSGHGDDTFVGTAGACTVLAGSGNATMWVGAGADTLQFTAGLTGGKDVISGFRPGVDHLAISGYGRPAAIVAANGSSVVRLADGTQITVLGVSTENLAMLA